MTKLIDQVGIIGEAEYADVFFSSKALFNLSITISDFHLWDSHFWVWPLVTFSQKVLENVI